MPLTSLIWQIYLINCLRLAYAFTSVGIHREWAVSLTFTGGGKSGLQAMRLLKLPTEQEKYRAHLSAFHKLLLSLWTLMSMSSLFKSVVKRLLISFCIVCILSPANKTSYCWDLFIDNAQLKKPLLSGL